MNKATWKMVLGMLWASPLTFVVFFCYVLPFMALGWYKPLGWQRLAWVFVMNEQKSPGWLKRMWARWSGHAIGNVVVLKRFDENTRYNDTTMTHEMTHVRQCMVFGPFMVLYYGLNTVFGKVLEKTLGDFDAYYDGPLELHARRCAGQVIDVVGYTKKLKAQKSQR